MTLEELADCTAEKLIGLKTEELDAILRPYYIYTRPELAPKVERQQSQQPQLRLSPKKMEALALIAEDGDVDLSFLQRKKKY